MITSLKEETLRLGDTLLFRFLIKSDLLREVAIFIHWNTRRLSATERSGKATH